MYFAVFFTACQKNIDYSYKLKYNPEAIVKKTNSKVFIVPLEILAEGDTILINNSKKVYNELKSYLLENKIKVVEDYDNFIKSYYSKLRKENGLFNPVTGQKDYKKQAAILNSVLSETLKKHSFDYFLISKFVMKRVNINKSTHYGKWDGIRKRLKIESPIRVFPTNPLALSLDSSLISAKKGLVLRNKVGLDFLVEVVKKDDERVSILRQKNLFKNKEHLNKSIKLTFDPFIPRNDG